jgi:hypothetical protein
MRSQSFPPPNKEFSEFQSGLARSSTIVSDAIIIIWPRRALVVAASSDRGGLVVTAFVPCIVEATTQSLRSSRFQRRDVSFGDTFAGGQSFSSTFVSSFPCSGFREDVK